MSAPDIMKSAVPVATDANNAPVGAVTVTSCAPVITSGTPFRVKSLQAMNTPAPVGEASAGTNSTLATKGKPLPKAPEAFYRDLQQFHERRSTPIMHMPKISGREVDLHRLYSEVTERGGFSKVNQRDEWDDVLPELGIRDKCVNATAAIKYIYRRCLEKYERQTFFGEDPDKLEALESADAMDGGARSRNRYPTSVYASSGGNVVVNTVPMSYNYRQHIVNMDRRRTYKLSTDLHKASPYEKLMLSLISPLPNEQDFAINVCSLMANESKHTLKLNEHPKMMDVLLAHTGVFSDYTLRKLFQHIYTQVREHSLFEFWRDLLRDKPHVLDLYTDEQAMREAGLIDDEDIIMDSKKLAYFEDSSDLDFLNLGRGEGTQEYVGQRIQQIVTIFRNLSFFEENLHVFAKNRTFLRFIVMGANIRWGNLHNQILDIAGNIATEIELTDPSTDEVSRSLLATLCDGIESMDRGVIINSMEILYKLCQKDSNEDHINKCLSLQFYETICQFLSLNDIMLLIFTLEAIFALTSMGNRSCHLIMQVRGIVDQLVSLITVEAQSYGPDGCILMRVVETVPGNMLPMVAQNIANLQNAAVIQKPPTHVLTLPMQLPAPQPPVPIPVMLPQINSSIIPHPQLPTVPLPSDSTDSVPNLQQQTPIIDQTISTHSQTTAPQQQPTTAQQQTPTATHHQPNPPQNFTPEDEQYALTWLGATVERTPTAESHVEQQELYRMYLAHCQKYGKHSVVNNVQFPRLVRLIYSSGVGPVSVRLNDGTDLAGLYYVGIRLRTQSLPIQTTKTLLTQPKLQEGKLPTKPAANDSSVFAAASGRKLKKKPKSQQDADVTSGEASNGTSVSTTVTTATQESDNTNQNVKDEVPSIATTTSSNSTVGGNPVLLVQSGSTSSAHSLALQQPADTSAQPSTSLIKSLLANKVTQRQQKNQKELNTNTTAPQQAQSSTSTNVSAIAHAQQPIKVASTAISALVNNPLMQNTPVKVGQTTIKPLNAQIPLEKKTILESTPPPLAPLSGNNVAKDSSGRPVIITNQTTTAIVKRKLEDSSEPAKRMALNPLSSKEEDQVTPSKNAANLYAEMAASILEDEDLEDIPPLPTVSTAPSTSTPAAQSTLTEPIQQQQPQQILIPAKIQQATVQGVQRQLLFQTNQPPQLKLTTHSGVASPATQLPTAMATIKTDQGLQTVPVILQQKALEQPQQQQLIQQVITQNVPQSAPQQQPTQYVLATNQQGQTYLVAQQPQPPQPPPQQTVLVTQTPQQQSAGTKTIIILQQQSLPGQQSHQPQPQLIAGAPQKMIMTTSQGQQVLVTQRPQPALPAPTTQQYFINPQTGTATHIQHVPVSSSGISTSVSGNNQLLQRHQILSTQSTNNSTTQSTTGQISPSLLSQLNHIPATIKLHQPQMPATTVQSSAHQHQTATISRLGKTVSIVQATPALAPPPPPIQIPQLQQHQSIIQQHIISGPSEKRQMILGGRAIEIKETVITQAPPPAQQSQLNSQTIITKQVLPQQQQQQQSQQMRAVIEQQHPSIIQQKFTLQQQPQKTGEHPSLIQATLPVKPQPVVQTVVQQPAPSQSPLSGNKAPPVQPVRAPTPQQQQQQQQVSVASANNKPIGSDPPPLAQSTRPTIGVHPQQQQFQQNETANTGGNSSLTTTAASASTVATTTAVAASNSNTPPPPSNVASTSQTPIPKPTLPVPLLPQVQLPPGVVAGAAANATPPLDPNWLFVCDWRNCPRRKYKSLNDLQHHACSLHCPDHLDPAAEIFCQWGVGPGLCDGIPRKRFSLMTHIIDRHLTNESLRAAMQRRIATGTVNLQPSQPPVTIVRNVEAAQAQAQRNNSSSPAPSTSSSSSGSQPTGIGSATGSSALHAIKRHTADYVNPKELMDENEGPVTKSIRLTAALILRNLVTYTNTAKRDLRRYEPHLSNVALSNVESSGAVSHILFEMNN
ncbi:PREDICTED: AT-rich interactive domain-containing protein 2 [Rhagoletis zephyria]|uniref:AT-rich interactive domain-containing protein 2 n=1 Tax=Rhagoletis zephyria TaxID=28612 RepID=UPI0008116F21|nr:PREDICTED: AT-rich interactive domain-containing protein 2 [Rhagoletis zephyria]